MTREIKSFRFSVKAVDDAQGLIEAYGSVFGNEDQGGDVVRPGAFKRTIQNSKARVQAGKANFLAMMLWQHNPDLPIGGWTDLKEDQHGLLCKGKIILETQLGKEAYELIKAGVINEFSIGYDIPNGGAEWDAKAGVRNLTELRLWEVSPVSFAMNQEALLVGVKNMELKTITGNTSGPIGPRDESWDAGKAEKQIWDVAVKDDGSLDTALCKKYFMVQDGDGSKKGDYSYPFWYVGDSPHICVGAVKAIAGAIQGSRGASAPDGLKGKVETLYNRINKQYPDAAQLTPPWSGDGKGSNRRMNSKTLLEHYYEETCEDLLEDWQDVYVCALTAAVFDALTIGDQPAQDISEALDAFKELVMNKFVAQAVEVGLSQYLADNDYSSNPSESTIHNGGDTYPMYGGYMSRRKPLTRKTGRAISGSNAEKIQNAADNLHTAADTAMAAMKEHTKAVHSAADDLATILQGSEHAYGTDPGTPEAGQEGKSRVTSRDRARGTGDRSSAKDTGSEDVDKALAALRDLRAVR